MKKYTSLQNLFLFLFLPNLHIKYISLISSTEATILQDWGHKVNLLISRDIQQPYTSSDGNWTSELGENEAIIIFEKQDMDNNATNDSGLSNKTFNTKEMQMTSAVPQLKFDNESQSVSVSNIFEENNSTIKPSINSGKPITWEYLNISSSNHDFGSTLSVFEDNKTKEGVKQLPDEAHKKQNENDSSSQPVEDKMDEATKLSVSNSTDKPKTTNVSSSPVFQDTTATDVVHSAQSSVTNPTLLPSVTNNNESTLLKASNNASGEISTASSKERDNKEKIVERRNDEINKLRILQPNINHSVEKGRKPRKNIKYPSHLLQHKHNFPLGVFSKRSNSSEYQNENQDLRNISSMPKGKPNKSRYKFRNNYKTYGKNKKLNSTNNVEKVFSNLRNLTLKNLTHNSFLKPKPSETETLETASRQIKKKNGHSEEPFLESYYKNNYSNHADKHKGFYRKNLSPGSVKLSHRKLLQLVPEENRSLSSVRNYKGNDAHLSKTKNNKRSFDLRKNNAKASKKRRKRNIYIHQKEIDRALDGFGRKWRRYNRKINIHKINDKNSHHRISSDNLENELSTIKRNSQNPPSVDEVLIPENSKIDSKKLPREPTTKHFYHNINNLNSEKKRQIIGDNLPGSAFDLKDYSQMFSESNKNIQREAPGKVYKITPGVEYMDDASALEHLSGQPQAEQQQMNDNTMLGVLDAQVKEPQKMSGSIINQYPELEYEQNTLPPSNLYEENKNVESSISKNSEPFVFKIDEETQKMLRPQEKREFSLKNENLLLQGTNDKLQPSLSQIEENSPNLVSRENKQLLLSKQSIPAETYGSFFEDSLDKDNGQQYQNQGLGQINESDDVTKKLLKDNSGKMKSSPLQRSFDLENAEIKTAYQALPSGGDMNIQNFIVTQKSYNTYLKGNQRGYKDIPIENNTVPPRRIIKISEKKIEIISHSNDPSGNPDISKLEQLFGSENGEKNEHYKKLHNLVNNKTALNNLFQDNQNKYNGISQEKEIADKQNAYSAAENALKIKNAEPVTEQKPYLNINGMRKLLSFEYLDHDNKMNKSNELPLPRELKENLSDSATFINEGTNVAQVNLMFIFRGSRKAKNILRTGSKYDYMLTSTSSNEAKYLLVNTSNVNKASDFAQMLTSASSNRTKHLIENVNKINNASHFTQVFNTSRLSPVLLITVSLMAGIIYVFAVCPSLKENVKNKYLSICRTHPVVIWQKIPKSPSAIEAPIY